MLAIYAYTKQSTPLNCFTLNNKNKEKRKGKELKYRVKNNLNHFIERSFTYHIQILRVFFVQKKISHVRRV